MTPMLTLMYSSLPHSWHARRTCSSSKAIPRWFRNRGREIPSGTLCRWLLSLAHGTEHHRNVTAAHWVGHLSARVALYATARELDRVPAAARSLRGPAMRC